MAMSLIGIALAMYGTKEVAKGVYKKGQRNSLEHNHNTNVDDVLNVIGGKKYLSSQPNAVKEKYLNYLHKTYGLNDNERKYYSNKFDKYLKVKQRVAKQKKMRDAQNGLDEYRRLKGQNKWRKQGASFKIELHRHCHSQDVKWKMQQTIKNTFLKEIITKSWIYDGREILKIDNVDYSNKSKIEKWYKQCWIKEHGKWTY